MKDDYTSKNGMRRMDLRIPFFDIISPHPFTGEGIGVGVISDRITRLPTCHERQPLLVLVQVAGK